MSQFDPDLLRKAAEAMRTQRTGHTAGSGFTRARILNDVRAGRKKRNRWWRIGFPVGIILAGTTAWASASGKWPEVWVNVSTLLNLPLTDNGASERSLATAKSHATPKPRLPGAKDSAQDLGAVAPAPTELAAAEVATAEATAVATAEAAPTPEPPSAAPNPGMTAAAVALASKATRSGNELPRFTHAKFAPEPAPSAAKPAPEAPLPPVLEAEIEEFRKADDLYRRVGDLRSAVSAYRDYIRSYPTGRFVPEAKYNSALALLKLGRTTEARTLLTPFADGAYGSYRQGAAQRLLDALPE